MKRSALFGWSFCLLWGFFSVSCVQKEYEINDLDLTVNVGGDSLALPLGATDTIYARTLLDETGAGAEAFLKELEDGTLAIRQDGGFDLEVPEVAAQRLALPHFAGESVCKLIFGAAEEQAAAAVAPAARVVGLTAPVADVLPVSTGLDDVPAEVKRIDYLTLADGAALVFTFDVSALAQRSDLAVAMDVLVDLPDYVRPAESVVLEDGKLRVRAAFDGHKLTQTVPLDGFDFSQFPVADGKMTITGEITYNGRLDLSSDDPSALTDWDGRRLDMDARYEVTHLSPRRFEGLFEPVIDPVVQTVTFGEIPDMLAGGETVFDFAAPYLLLSIPTNIGLALENELAVTPVMQGVPQTDLTAKVRLALPARLDARTDTTRYYLANERPAQLPAGFEFAEFDLAGILRRIPDALQIEVTTHADRAADMVYDFGAHYTAAADYDFIVPMAFGDDLHLSFGDTIAGLPDLVNEILSKNVLRLGGEVWNSMPMDLTLGVVALDEKGEEVPMETEPQRIKAGTPSGEAVASPLALTLGDRTGAVDTRPVKALALRFTLTTGHGNAGVPVKATSWVRAVLKAEIPGGITVDLKELGSADEGSAPMPDERI
ncbi:MAG: hypothetical protein K2H70_01505 [Bacteroidales bacterium]|nr:hypothetical protein [Bacteroidales bacterium]